MGLIKKKTKETGNVLRPPSPEEPHIKGKRVQQQSEKTKGKGKSLLTMPLTLLRNLLDGTLLTHDRVMKNIPFILFITLLTILYITNATMADRNRREFNLTHEELKELRYKYISTKSGVMYESNQSQISYKLKETGIKENITPPVKVFIQPNTDNPKQR